MSFWESPTYSHCNFTALPSLPEDRVACDYCCVRSSPQSDRRALGIDRIRQLASEAVRAGVSELLLTGSEPFLLPDVDEVVAVWTAVLPTTLLTSLERLATPPEAGKWQSEPFEGIASAQGGFGNY